MGGGYDPEVNAPCQFDDCRTFPIFKFSYEGDCRTVLTPGGTFKIPDQITVLNKYETDARTEVYQNEEQEEQAVAASAGLSTDAFGGSVSASVSAAATTQGSKQVHVAVCFSSQHIVCVCVLACACVFMSVYCVCARWVVARIAMTLTDELAFSVDGRLARSM